MAGIALILSIIALIFAYLAYTRSGGSTEEMKAKVEDLGITTENLRKKTADALNRLERSIRGQADAPKNKGGDPAADSEVIIEPEPEEPDDSGKTP